MNPRAGIRAGLVATATLLSGWMLAVPATAAPAAPGAVATISVLPAEEPTTPEVSQAATADPQPAPEPTTAAPEPAPTVDTPTSAAPAPSPSRASTVVAPTPSATRATSTATATPRTTASASASATGRASATASATATATPRASATSAARTTTPGTTTTGTGAGGTTSTTTTTRAGTTSLSGATATPTASPSATGSAGPAGPAGPANSVTVDLGDMGDKPSTPVVVILAMTLLSLLPAILLTCTSFTKILVVLSLTRNALGLQQTPPNQVLVGLALFLSMFVMGPVLGDVYDAGVKPYMDGSVTASQAFDDGLAPLRTFMLDHTDDDELALLTRVADQELPASREDVPTATLVPAFVLTELKEAFTIGFIIFVPFLVIDMVVSGALMALGMMMMPPVMVSLPFKLLLFVLVNGWGLVIESLVASYG